MNSEIEVSSDNHRAYSNKSVNRVLVSFDLSREDLALGKV
jgi:hypothetical protein